MESRKDKLTKFQLWRTAFLLLSMFLLASGVLGWWKSRSERLQCVEPIWSDSLVGQENVRTPGPQRKIGEIWSLSRTTGFRILGRGLCRHFEGRFPMFDAGNAFQNSVSEGLLSERRRISNPSNAVTWSEWWEHAKKPRTISTLDVSCEMIFVGSNAISLCEEKSELGNGMRYLFSRRGRTFVNCDGKPHELELSDLFRDASGFTAVSDLCLLDLRRQGAKWVQSAEIAAGLKLNQFNGSIASSFVLTPEGLRIILSPLVVGPYSDGPYEVLLPFEKLAEHLKPDGPHQLFQMKVGE